MGDFGRDCKLRNGASFSILGLHTKIEQPCMRVIHGTRKQNGILHLSSESTHFGKIDSTTHLQNSTREII